MQPQRHYASLQRLTEQYELLQQLHTTVCVTATPCSMYPSRWLCACAAACCSVLLCVAVCCGVSQHVTVCCSELQHVPMEVSWAKTPLGKRPARVAVWYSVWQCGAVCGSVVQCVAVWCTMLQRGTVCGSVSQCVAVCCSVLQCVAARTHGVVFSQDTDEIVVKCVAVYCSVLQCVAVCCSVLQCVAVCPTVLQCLAVYHSVLQSVAARTHGSDFSQDTNGKEACNHRCYLVKNSKVSNTRCNTLQYTATHCPTLQHTATHCNALQHTTTHCNTLQLTAKLYILMLPGKNSRSQQHTLQHTATHCNTLQHTATHCNTLRHTATHCNTMQHNAKYSILMLHGDKIQTSAIGRLYVTNIVQGGEDS